MAITTTLLLLTFSFIATEAGFNPCNGPDCVQHVSTTAKCTETTIRAAAADCRWASSMNRRLDQEILGVTIYAYKIKWWGNAPWSDWYIPGENDLDLKFNMNSRTCYPPKYNYIKGSLRRMWAYFSDHKHKFIYCGTLGQSQPNVVSLQKALPKDVLEAVSGPFHLMRNE